MKGIAEVSKETLQIETYLQTLNPGEQVLYSIIETETGIKMDERGKSCLRSALRRLRLNYTRLRSPNTGKGYILASPENSVGIVVENVMRVDKGIRKTHKVTESLKKSFYSQLNDQDKNSLDFVHRETGAMLAFARLITKGVFAKEKPKVINV
jgi:hypothetical protein